MAFGELTKQEAPATLVIEQASQKVSQCGA
jgi:hypothetical protein